MNDATEWLTGNRKKLLLVIKLNKFHIIISYHNNNGIL